MNILVKKPVILNDARVSHCSIMLFNGIRMKHPVQ